MDDIARYNKARWEALADAGVIFSRPWLELDPLTARSLVDPHGLMGELRGKSVLCLAAGGGQQSAAFGLLGARVTVLDLSATQLHRDQEAAAHYGFHIDTVQGDMRDLSRFRTSQFDFVWQAYGINFVPEPLPVIREVARVIRKHGLYRMEFHNPFVAGLNETMWDGQGYPLSQRYVDGAEIVWDDPAWEFEDEAGLIKRVAGPREFRHTLSTLINGLVNQGFVILGLWEEISDEDNPEQGTWEHFTQVAPPWIQLWTRFLPEAFGNARSTG